MAGNGLTWLNIAEMAGNGWKLREIARNCSKWPENIWKWLEMNVMMECNGWKWLKMA